MKTFQIFFFASQTLGVLLFSCESDQFSHDNEEIKWEEQGSKNEKWKLKIYNNFYSTKRFKLSVQLYIAFILLNTRSAHQLFPALVGPTLLQVPQLFLLFQRQQRGEQAQHH